MIGKMIKTGLESTMNAFVEEMKTIFTDGGAILLLIVAVTIYPVVYSIAYKNNVVRDIPVAVVDLDRSQLSRQMSRMLDATKEVAVHTETGNMEEAQKLFWD